MEEFAKTNPEKHIGNRLERYPDVFIHAVDRIAETFPSKVHPERNCFLHPVTGTIDEKDP